MVALRDCGCEVLAVRVHDDGPTGATRDDVEALPDERRAHGAGRGEEVREALAELLRAQLLLRGDEERAREKNKEKTQTWQNRASAARKAAEARARGCMVALSLSKLKLSI